MAETGYFLTKKTVVVIGVVFVGALVIIGVSVGVTGKSQAAVDSGKPTGEPSTQSPSTPSHPASNPSTRLPTTTPPTTTPTPTTTPVCKGPHCQLRIPREIYEPSRYDLTLEPDMEATTNATFKGTVIITITVKKPTSSFNVHVKDLTVLSASFPDKDNEVARQFYYEPNEFFVVVSKSEIGVGETRLELKFQGFLTHGIVGFYRSTYKDENNKVHPLVTSKFEPSDARKAFPCFDEPNLKANFTVTLVYPPTVDGLADYYALSNMPPDGDATAKNGKMVQKFQESVKMSTYLVCFIVCDFDSIGKTTNGQVDLSVYAPKGTIDQAKYALDVGATILDYYDEYYGIPYPLPKQDLIAIPDFASGAMEHWGLVTFRMTALLYDPAKASISEKRRVATVVAHELAHMWFGNLVTMDWWDDLWLNEGFASFVEYLGTNATEPDWKILDQFLALDMNGVMVLDSTNASHPIIAQVDSPDQVTSLFDTITYSKGCSVIRMLESYLGSEDFRNGVTLYLNNQKWGNAKTEDLWAAMSNESSQNIDVGSMMASWTQKAHYPVITVKLEVSKPGMIRIKLAQEPFLLNKGATAEKTVWSVPITYQFGNMAVPSKPILMDAEMKEINSPGIIENGVFKLNVGQTGFYRVNYEEATWKALSTALKEDVNALDPVDRAGLWTDAFNLARAGKLQYSTALSLLDYLDQETDYVPWKLVSSALSYLTDVYEGEQKSKWLSLIADKAGQALKTIGYEGSAKEDTSRTFTRPVVMAMACRHGDQGCLKFTKQQFALWLSGPDPTSIDLFAPTGPTDATTENTNGPTDATTNTNVPTDVPTDETTPATPETTPDATTPKPTPGQTTPEPTKTVDPNIRSQVYNYGMMHADEEEWNQVFDIYNAASSPQEKKKLLSALATTRTPWILRRYIDYAKDESKGIRMQDYYSVMEYIANNPVGLSIVWDHVRANWVSLVARFGLGDRYFGRMVNRIVSHFNDEFKLEEVKSFFAKYPEAGAGEQSRLEAIVNIQDNINWRKDSEMDLTTWLEGRN